MLKTESVNPFCVHCQMLNVCFPVGHKFKLGFSFLIGLTLVNYFTFKKKMQIPAGVVCLFLVLRLCL